MNDQELVELELKISYLLRYGVLVAGFLLLCGWLATLHTSGNPFTEFHNYQAQNLGITLRQVWSQRSWGLMIAYVGLIALISLPVLRVLMTVLLFMKQGERVLATIAFVVLVSLAISMLLGLETAS